MARLRVSAGMLTDLASSMAALRRMFPLGSPPPTRAAVVISRISFENRLSRCWPVFAFLRLIWAHFEWPDIRSPTFRQEGESQQSPGRDASGLRPSGRRSLLVPLRDLPHLGCASRVGHQRARLLPATTASRAPGSPAAAARARAAPRV